MQQPPEPQHPAGAGLAVIEHELQHPQESQVHDPPEQHAQAASQPAQQEPAQAVVVEITGLEAVAKSAIARMAEIRVMRISFKKKGLERCID